MKHLLLLIITLIVFANIAFAQGDTLFKEKHASQYFLDLKHDEIKEQYTWNDTSQLITEYFKNEATRAQVNIGISVGLLILGPILISIPFNSKDYGVSSSIILFTGFISTVAGIISLPSSLILAVHNNKSNLYKKLRAYRLKGEINSKYLKNKKCD